MTGKRDQLAALRAENERVLEGDERREALAALDELEKAIGEGDRIVEELRVLEAKQRVWRRLLALFVTLPFACVPLYFALSAIVTGRTPITFSDAVDYTYWSADPFVFALVIALLSTTGLVFLYTALVPLVTGEDAPVSIGRAPPVPGRRAVPPRP